VARHFARQQFGVASADTAEMLLKNAAHGERGQAAIALMDV
jgi:hypothetical protein